MGTSDDKELISFLVEQTYLDLERPRANCAYDHKRCCFVLTWENKSIEIPENWGIGLELKFLKNGFQIYISDSSEYADFYAVLSPWLRTNSKGIFIRKVWPGYFCRSLEENDQFSVEDEAA